MGEKNQILTASFFGQLQIVYKGIKLTEDDIHSEMITKLLAYLLLHRKRAMTVRELSDILWGESEGSDNPGGALKNLMYRLRGVLKRTYGAKEQFVITNLGSYCWNHEIQVILDAEEFEACMKTAKASEEPDMSIREYEAAIGRYQGRFLDKHAVELWVVPLAAYYHSLFLTGVKALAVLYEQQKCFEEMEEVCNGALRYDNLDEEIHCLELRALIAQNKQSMALTHYENTVKLFYDNLGLSNLPKLRAVYEQILSMKKVSGTAQMEEICQDVQEGKAPDGAYICGYAVFREIYRIEARRVSRMGISEYVLLLTLALKKESSQSESVKRYLMNRVMDRMENILRSSLRIGDVAARYSDSQFLVLLPACSYEAEKNIARRISEEFRKDDRNQKYRADFYIEKVCQAGDDIMNRKFERIDI